MSLFAKAKSSAAKSASAPSKKQTLWMAGTSEEDLKVAQSIKTLTDLTREKKAIEAKMGVHKSIVKRYADKKYVATYVETECSPESPMIVQNGDGEKVTYVVQDRSASSKVSDEQIDALKDLLGPEGAERVIWQETSFGFNPEALAQDGVMEVLEKHLEKAVKEIEKNDLLPEGLELLSASTQTAFKPGTLKRLTSICGKDHSRVKQFLDIMAGACVRYVRP